MAPVSSAGTPPAPSTARPGLPLVPLVVGLVCGSALLAAGAGFGLASWLGASEAWVAALAAGLGMLLTALPLGAVLVGLARASEVGEASAAGVGASAGAALGRAQFIDLAEREWARARRYGSGAALLLVEVDRHARLVDSFGRDGAETVMRALAGDIAPTLRAADALARFADGQLAVFLAQADATGALDVAERIREGSEALETQHGGHGVRVTVSVGVAHLRPAHLNLQALIEDAGDAVLAARQSGGNCVRAAPVEPGRLAAPPRPDQRARKP
jgi:diguanylate cyclase (GGDEF)-like protein